MGEPVGKARPRFVRATGHAYTPAKTRNYETALRYAGQRVMGDARPLDGPIVVCVEAYMPIPQSWSQRKRADALSGKILPTTKPDIDNLQKCLDALNNVVWLDDKQIVTSLVSKRYSADPRFVIKVSRIANDGAVDSD